MLAYKQNLRPMDRPAQDISDNEWLEKEILRLWEAGWSGRKIAEYLSIKPAKVGNTVCKHGKARKPRGVQRRRGETVGLQDAPVEAWQQAVMPDLLKLADELGFQGSHEEAFIISCLLHLKDYVTTSGFLYWAQAVTGYAKATIEGFIERGEQNGILINGLPNNRIFPSDDDDEATFQVGYVLIACALEGSMEVTEDGRWSVAREASRPELDRMDDDGGLDGNRD